MSSNSNDRVIRADNGRRDPMANALRALAMDAVQQANSGHPGAPMGMAEMAVALWGGHLRHNPANPQWADRDRFVLSNGHASMLLYALLHLTGYDLPIDELKRFRQLHSKTPGHPEVGLTPGVETTTGPLGQGLANAVGMALAEKLLADEFNRPGHAIVDHRSYVFLGDGCLMEGISHEACALAGAWQLNKLIALYDDNGISIDGAVQGWFIDDTPARFRAYGWHVIGPIDGHDVVAVGAGDRAGQGVDRQADADRLPHHHRQGLAGARGHAPRRTANRWAPTRSAPRARPSTGRMRRSRFRRRSRRVGMRAPLGAAREAEWQARFVAYRAAHPELAARVRAAHGRRAAARLRGHGRGRGGRVRAIARCGGHTQGLAAGARAAGAEGARAARRQRRPDRLEPDRLPGLRRGARWRAGRPPHQLRRARVRHGRGDERLALHGGFIPYGGTFLTFSDYSRNAIRMAALMKQRVIHVFTHDSIGLGEDGPTHQPVEHAASLRLIPNLDVWRPCDAAETAVAWTQRAGAARTAVGAAAVAPEPAGATARARPGAGHPPRRLRAERPRRGGGRDPRHRLRGGAGDGGAATAGRARARRARGVAAVDDASSIARSAAYRDAVLGRGLPRVGVEAGVTRWWGQYGCVAALGVDGFGESAPASRLAEHFGLTAASLAELVQAQCGVQAAVADRAVG